MRACMAMHGHFTDDFQAFRFPALQQRRHWENYLFSDRFYARVAEDGSGISAYKHAHGPLSQLNRGKRLVYFRERGTGKTTVLPRLNAGVEVEHAIGYTQFSGEADGCDCSFRIAVPDTGFGEWWGLALTNRNARAVTYDVFAVMSLHLAGYFSPFEERWSTPAVWDEGRQALRYVNQDAQCRDPYYNFFAAGDRPPAAFETIGELFEGDGARQGLPEAIARGSLGRGLHLGGDVVLAALQFPLTVEPGATERLQCTFGVYNTLDEIDTVLDALRADGDGLGLHDKWGRLRERYSRSLPETPDATLNRLFAYWTPYNLDFTARYTRVYSRGFRDVLQDTAGIASIDAGLARDNLLTALGHMFASGRCLRAWSSSSPKALTHEFYADGPVWIPIALNAYIRETGDTGILDVEVPYYDEGTGTVWEHLLKALRFLGNDRGEHGLCRIHDGDWCDTAHLLGREGRGEGVWLSMALYSALGGALELARHVGRTAEVSDFEALRASVQEAVNAHGWDGDWYRIAFNDAGTPVGTAQAEEGRLFLNPQSWAVISGIAPAERVEACFAAIDRHLERWTGPALLTPAFTHKQEGIGSLSGFHPGTIENGSSYCHAGTFKILADCLAGRGDAALRSLLAILPGGTADARNPQADCPPYAYTNCRIAPEHPYLAGRHLNSWTTGTVAWCWIVVTQHLLGVRPEFDGLRIDPCLPTHWTQCSVRRRFRGADYHIRIENPKGLSKGTVRLSIDGKPFDGDTIPAPEQPPARAIEVIATLD